MFNFKMPVVAEKEAKKNQSGECIGCLYWHAHPENIGRFTGKINEVNIASFPNRSKTSEQHPDFIITSNKETGYKKLGEMHFDDKTETFTGTFENIDSETGELKAIEIFIKKYAGKLTGKKAPSHMIIKVGE